jgi:hypothetical protein
LLYQPRVNVIVLTQSLNKNIECTWSSRRQYVNQRSHFIRTRNFALDDLDVFSDEDIFGIQMVSQVFGIHILDQRHSHRAQFVLMSLFHCQTTRYKIKIIEEAEQCSTLTEIEATKAQGRWDEHNRFTS